MFPLHDDNPTRSPPVVTVLIIVVCVLAFFWQLAQGPQAQEAITYSLGFIPALLFTEASLPPELAILPSGLTMFTAMFLHGGWMHLIGNMLFLWIFGNNVEESMGRTRFVVFYLACGVAAALSQALPEPESIIPMIGASGAISGVLGAYLILHPFARVLVVIPLGFYPYLTRLPAAIVLGLWFLIQILSSLTVNPAEGGVAWFAHIGGFVAGVLLVPLFRRRDVPLLAPPKV